MRVQFLVATEPYSVNDVIEVSEDRGEDLIRQGLAKQVESTVPVNVASEEKEEEKPAPAIEHKAIEGSENK
jgi:hypothetical protein